jgi:hypothetical protein
MHVYVRREDVEHSAEHGWCVLSNDGSVHALSTHVVSLLLPPVAGTFSCTMKFTVRDCDPNTGVPDEDGYDDEYVVSLPCRDLCNIK